MNKPLKVIAGAPDRPLVIGDIEIPCYVLEDGTRALTQAGFLEALGRHRKANVRKEGGEERIPAILQGKAINPFISKEVLEKSTPIRFRTQSGVLASGYQAELLPAVCEIYLRGRDAGALPKNQEHVARQADILIRGLANVGIIALVDEATGYQQIREKRALATILEKFIEKELQPWTRTFPYEFYQLIYKLKRWPGPDGHKRPAVIGHYTNNLVYDRLAPGVLGELKRRTPRLPSGNRPHKFFQWFTPNFGHPKLKDHLIGVMALMRAAPNWNRFMGDLNRAYPPQNETIPMALDDNS